MFLELKKSFLLSNEDDLELENLKHLQLTQEEMERMLSIIEEGSPSTSLVVSPKSVRRIGGEDNLTPTSTSSMKRGRWKKHLGWIQSPGKSSSIEEENFAVSPKKSQSLYTTTPSHSPKHRTNVKSDESVNEESPSRRQRRRIDKATAEMRASAGARLIQMFDNNDERLEVLLNEFGELSLHHNSRPASIHVTQKSNPLDEF